MPKSSKTKSNNRYSPVKLPKDLASIKKVIIRSDYDPFVLVETDSPYIKIGSYIFQVKFFDNKWVHAHDKIDLFETIALNPQQYKLLSSNIRNGSLVITNYYPKKTRSIDFILLCIESNSLREIIIDKEDLDSRVINFFQSQIFSTDQSFSFIYNEDIFTLRVKTTYSDPNSLGKITSHTKIDYDFISDNIFIYDQTILIDPDQVKIIVESFTDVVSKSLPLPLIISSEEFDSKARPLIPTFFHKEKYICCADDMEIKFRTVCLVSPVRSKYETLYKINDIESKIFIIKSITPTIVITTKIQLSTKIFLSVISGKSSKLSILNLSELKDFIYKSMPTIIVINQEFTYNILDKEYSIKIISITPHSDPHTSYTYTKDTKLSFSTSPNSNHIICPNELAINLEEVTFKIMPCDSSDIIFDEKKLSKIVQEYPQIALRGLIPIGYKFHQIKLKAIELKFPIEEKTSIENKIAPPTYPTKCLITPQTIIKYKLPSSTSSVMNTHAIKDLSINDSMEQIEKFVGGLSDQLRKLIQTISFQRRSSQLLPIKPIKGIILYGEPGTGKTTLARNIGKIIGCTPDTFKLMSGPSIFKKYVGQSEKNVRNIFKPARTAWKKFGSKSPLYLTVIDEIDAMLPVRTSSSGNPVRDSVVNQFLAELDGLEEFENFICIGITNRLELLDPAVIRPGRLGTHIKIDLPNKEARKEIFNIHTKKLSSQIDLPNIDIDKIISKTDTFSGADIENIIQLASMTMLDRLDRLENKSSQTLITESDLLLAIEEINKSNKKNASIDNYNHIYL